MKFVRCPSSHIICTLKTLAKSSFSPTSRLFASVASFKAESPEPTPTVSSIEIDPLQSYDYFGVRRLVTVRDLMEYRCHLGHKSSLRHPHMTPYLFGSRQDLDIINLDKTMELLGDALNFTAHVAHRGGIILFVSRNRMMSPLVERTAQMCGEYSHTRAWGGPVFTDADKFFGVVTRLPDLVIFLHTLNIMKVSHSALRDAKKMLIPCTGLLDTNCDPRHVDYPVPCNDDSPSSVRLMAALFSEAIMRGKGMKETLLPIRGEAPQEIKEATVDEEEKKRGPPKLDVSQKYLRGKSIRWKYRDVKRDVPVRFNLKP